MRPLRHAGGFSKAPSQWSTPFLANSTSSRSLSATWLAARDWVVAKRWIGEQVGTANHLGHRFRELVVAGGDHEMPVGRT